jgi:hypothetical protein
MTSRPTIPTKVSEPTAVSRIRRGWIVLLVLAMVVQLVVLYVPTAPGGPGLAHLDKLIHASVFAAPTLVGLMAGLSRWWVVGLLALHAPVSELLQASLLAHRDGSGWDVVADLTGVLLALAVFLVWRRTRR